MNSKNLGDEIIIDKEIGSVSMRTRVSFSTEEGKLPRIGGKVCGGVYATEEEFQRDNQ